MSKVKRFLGALYRKLSKLWVPTLAALLHKCGFKYRFVFFQCYGIGHLAVEPDLFLKEELLGIRPPFPAIWLAPRDLLANRHLFAYWARRFRVVQSPWIARLLLPFVQTEQLGFETYAYALDRHKASRYPQIQLQWQHRPPLLALNEEDRDHGWSVLKTLGVPEGAWFVCVHCRESGFRPNETFHAFRDADIMTYVPAMEAVTARGGWCIRMGDKTMKPLPKLPNVIDYALDPAKSEPMDVFLCAACTCFLGSNSGLCNIADIFGVPVAMANQVPLAHVLPYGYVDLAIPKLYWSAADQRFLTFKEIFDSPSCGYDESRHFARAEITLVDNSPEEIRELLLELLETANATVAYTKEDNERQRRFKSLMRPEHMTYGAGSRVGRHFLRQHERLYAATPRNEAATDGTDFTERSAGGRCELGQLAPWAAMRAHGGQRAWP